MSTSLSLFFIVLWVIHPVLLHLLPCHNMLSPWHIVLYRCGMTLFIIPRQQFQWKDLSCSVSVKSYKYTSNLNVASLSVTMLLKISKMQVVCKTSVYFIYALWILNIYVRALKEISFISDAFFFLCAKKIYMLLKNGAAACCFLLLLLFVCLFFQ